MSSWMREKDAKIVKKFRFMVLEEMVIIFRGDTNLFNN